MTGVGKDIVEYLKAYHTDESHAIKGRELRVLFNLTDKGLRAVISGVRQEGAAVCSSSYGYWYSTDPDDVEKTVKRLEGQVKNMNISIAGLKKVLIGGIE